MFYSSILTPNAYIYFTSVLLLLYLSMYVTAVILLY